MSEETESKKRSRSSRSLSGSQYSSADMGSASELTAEDVKYLCKTTESEDIGSDSDDASLDELLNEFAIEKEEHVRTLIKEWVTKKSAANNFALIDLRNPDANAPDPDTANTENYTERGRENLFKAYTHQCPVNNTSDGGQESKSSNADDSWKSYPVNPHGSLIKKGSRSDFAVLNMETGGLFEFEFKYSKSEKNESEKIKVQNKIKIEDKCDEGFYQLVGYLYNQLWWFRTVQGLGVEKICGFVVVANTEKEWRIVIVEISMPEKVGGKFKLSKFETNKRNEGLKKMETAMKKEFYNIPNLKRSKDPSCPIGLPAAMMIPPKLLKQEGEKWFLKAVTKPGEEEKECVWELVENGTGNLVLRFTPKTSPDMKEEDIKKRVETAKSSMEENVEFEEDHERLEEKEENLNRLKDFIEACENQPIYIKIKARASGRYWHSNAVENIHRSKIEWMNKLYPKKFFIQNHCNVMILMRHMGCRLDELEGERKLEWSSFCSQFLQLMNDTIQIQRKTFLVHGDIHRGNLLYDKNKNDEKNKNQNEEKNKNQNEEKNKTKARLCIIDWDEAFVPMETSKRRRKGGKNGKERYPTIEGMDHICLTKVQLFVLFRDVILENYNKDLKLTTEQVEVNQDMMQIDLQIVTEGGGSKGGLLWPLLKKQTAKNAEQIVAKCYESLVSCLTTEAQSDGHN